MPSKRLGEAEPQPTQKGKEMAAKGSEGTKKIEPGSDLPLMCFLSLLWPNKILRGSGIF
jgi:hypothetical protein